MTFEKKPFRSDSKVAKSGFKKKFNQDNKKRSFNREDKEQDNRRSSFKRRFNDDAPRFERKGEKRFDKNNRGYKKQEFLEEFEDEFELEQETRRRGFSPFQLRLVTSIITDVLVKKIGLDKAYAYWFNKVKINSLEQGFLIRQINFMFSRLSYFAYVSNLKRPSDFERHVQRLIFSYCAYKNWTLPELQGEDGFDRTGLNKRIAKGLEDPLFKDGCPRWLQELGYTELKEKWDEQREALGLESRRFIRTNLLKGTREELAHVLSEEGVVTKPVAGVRNALEVTSNSALFRTKAFKEGRFEQQDAGSQQIGAFVEAKPGLRIVDTCAGSGGKTLQLAADMAGKGVLIAMDTEQWKLLELKKRAKRAGAFNIETRVIESTKNIKRMHESADKVLIDAPCSGLGVIRRMPDSKWRDGRANLNKMREIQADILDRYSKIAKIGGEVIYSTCSILPSENELQIQAFLAKNEGKFELVEDKHILPSSGFDGFYMAKLKRLA